MLPPHTPQSWTKVATAAFTLLLSLSTAQAQLAPAQSIAPPSPFAVTPTSAQQQALQNATPQQLQTIQSVITPKLQQAIQDHQNSSTGSFRSWREILASGSSIQSNATAQTASSSSTAALKTVNFYNNGATVSSTAVRRVYHPALASTSKNKSAAVATPQDGPVIGCCHPISPNTDRDFDGLPDFPDPDFGPNLEDPLAQAFMPIYHISSGEQQQFATFADSVPWTVVNTLGQNPNSYYHVTPLGLTTDSSGNQLYAIRVDYLSLWNADGGLVGGGAACFYSYFGLDSVINQLSGHALDAERSVMLLAAPAVNGSYNPDPNAYSLYTIYTAAHEGTFFDESEYADFTTPVPAGNHIELSQSLSKHSTYGFNPDYSPITPAWFIASTNAGITAAWLDGEIDDGTYLLITAMADDTFYGCLVERFGDQGGVSPNPISNVGEVAHPLNGNGFIQDNSSAALNLADKLTNPVF